MTATATAHATDSYGNNQTLSGGTWSSTSPSIMTVSNSGFVNGVAVGQVTIGDAFTNVIVVQGNYCHSDNMPNCATANVSAGGPGNVVSATISQRTSNQVSSDNAAKQNYTNAEGTSNLGPILSSSAGCDIGFETVGNISPSVYTGQVVIHRTRIARSDYVNSTLTQSLGSADDTSGSSFRDDDPQSGGSGGKVYDLDAPGVAPGSSDGNTYRERWNFYTYAALPNGAPISPNYYFYVRVSCTKTPFGYQFVNDVPGDNQIGSGTTSLTWNLQ